MIEQIGDNSERARDYQIAANIIDKLRKFVVRNLKKDVDRCKDQNDATTALCAYLGFFSQFYGLLLDMSPLSIREQCMRDLEQIRAKLEEV